MGRLGVLSFGKRGKALRSISLYFHEQLLNSTPLSIPQSTLLNDRLEYPQIVDMKGMGTGEYLFRIEMYELWSSGEKLNFTLKEITVRVYLASPFLEIRA